MLRVEGQEGPSTLGQLTNPEMRVEEGMWSIWEVQGHQQRRGKVTQER